VLVSDVGMPQEDGYELIRSVRHEDGGHQQPRLPAIAVTAYAREDDRNRALAAGYDRHVTKPVDAGALVQAIAEVVGPRSAHGSP
jgi:CheY-like chemotaxis protein